MKNYMHACKDIPTRKKIQNHAWSKLISALVWLLAIDRMACLITYYAGDEDQRVRHGDEPSCLLLVLLASSLTSKVVTSKEDEDDRDSQERSYGYGVVWQPWRMTSRCCGYFIYSGPRRWVLFSAVRSNPRRTVHHRQIAAHTLLCDAPSALWLPFELKREVIWACLLPVFLSGVMTLVKIKLS